MNIFKLLNAISRLHSHILSDYGNIGQWEFYVTSVALFQLIRSPQVCGSSNISQGILELLQVDLNGIGRN